MKIVINHAPDTPQTAGDMLIGDVAELLDLEALRLKITLGDSERMILRTYDGWVMLSNPRITWYTDSLSIQRQKCRILPAGTVLTVTL